LIDRALSQDTEAPAVLARMREELEHCIDVLVRSGIPSARALEVRLRGSSVLDG
jgi:hypothetical protein